MLYFIDEFCIQEGLICMHPRCADPDRITRESRENRGWMRIGAKKHDLRRTHKHPQH
jgi:hypothetical protein